MNKILLAGSAALVGVAALVLVVLSTQNPLPATNQQAQVSQATNKFSNGDKVKVTLAPGDTAYMFAQANLSSNKLGSVGNAVTGTVVGGPTVNGGHTWYQVKFDSSISGCTNSLTSDCTTGWDWEDDFALVAPVVPPPPAPTISSLNASNITTTGATITWTTNVGADSQVLYGLTNAYGSQTATDASLVTSHSAVLTGLTANTTYHYQVVVSNPSKVSSADMTFTTPVDTSKPTNKFNVGDRVQITGVTSADPARIFSTSALTGTYSKEAPGALGTVKSGPTTDSRGNVLYQVAFDDGVTGWDYQTYFTLCTGSSCSGTANMYKITASTAGTGSGTVTCNSTTCGSYTSGTVVTISASPATGSTFTSWGGACSGTSQTCSLTVTSNQTVTATFTGSPTTPSAPSNLTATAKSSTEVDLSWGASSGTLTGYHVYRGTSATSLSNFQNVTGGTTFQNTLSVNPATTYYYAVSAYSGTAESAKSNVVSVTTPPGNSTLFSTNQSVKTTATVNVRSSATIPATGTNVTGTQPANAVGTIATVANQGIYDSSNYWWYVSFNSGVSGWVSQTNLVANTVTTYTFSVSKSGTGTGTVTATCGGLTCPSSVNSGTAATILATPTTGSKATVTVNNSATTCSGSTTACTVNTTVSANTAVVATFDPVSSACSTKFCAGDQVQVNSSDGIFVFSSAGGAYSPTLPTQASGALGTIVSATTVGGVVWYNVNFNTGTDGWNTESYFLKYAPVTLGVSVGSGSGTVMCNGAACATTVASGAQISILATPASGYAFAGWTTNPSGICSGTTNPCVATITANSTVSAAFAQDTVAPSAPANLTGSVSGTSVSLTWGASTDNYGVAGYKIMRNGSQIATSQSASYTDTNTSPSTTYTYTVTAYDAANNTSAASNSFSATTGVAAAFPPTIPGVSSDRTIDWSTAGVQGGIPTDYTNCQTVSSVSALTSAVSSCGNGTIINVAAGTYTLNVPLIVTKSIIIRGAGPAQTKFISGQGTLANGQQVYGGIYFAPKCGVTQYYSLDCLPSTQAINWSANYTKGMTTLKLDSVSGLSVGQDVVLDQHNDTSLIMLQSNDGSGSCGYKNGPCGRGENLTCNSTYYCGFSQGDIRARFQTATIKSIDTTNKTITINEPLQFTFSSNLAPQVFSWNSSVKRAGLENVTFDEQQNNAVIGFAFCSSCWAKNINVMNTARGGIFTFYTNHLEIRDSYFDGRANPAQENYTTEIALSGNFLLENNIFYGSTAGVMIGWPDNGGVIGYNYFLNDAPKDNGTKSSLWADSWIHDAHTSMLLYEGNSGEQMRADLFHGSASHITYFRNRESGYNAVTPKVNINIAMLIEAFHQYTTMAGNVLGTKGISTSYDAPSRNYGIYSIESSTALVGNDGGATQRTAIRTGDWDVVTNGVKTWAVAGNTTLPTSMYKSGTPAFFSMKNATWGTPAWPPIGPDVTASGDTTGHYSKIPAQLCYENTVAKGNTFDAKNCYGGY